MVHLIFVLHGTFPITITWKRMDFQKMLIIYKQPIQYGLKKKCAGSNNCFAELRREKEVSKQKRYKNSKLKNETEVTKLQIIIIPLLTFITVNNFGNIYLSSVAILFFTLWKEVWQLREIVLKNNIINSFRNLAGDFVLCFSMLRFFLLSPCCYLLRKM